MLRIRSSIVLALVAGFYALTLGCVTSHFNGDPKSLTMEGYAPSAGTVTVSFWNYTTNAYVATHTFSTDTTSNLWYQTNDLYRWTWAFPSIIPAQYKSAGRVRIQFSQGGSPFYIYNESGNTGVPGAADPGACVVQNLNNYVQNTDWSVTNLNTVLHVENYRIFTTCGGSALNSIEIVL